MGVYGKIGYAVIGQVPNMPLDREILLQTLAGYAEVNRITQAERRSRLKSRTDQESLSIFSELYQAWETTGKREAGDWGLIAQQRLNDHNHLRHLLEEFARKRGDI